MRRLPGRAREFLRPALFRYRVLATVWTANLVLIALVFTRNLGQVEKNPLTVFYAQTVVGYYALPLLLVVFAVFLVLVPLRRTVFVVTGALAGLFVYYLFLDSLVYAVSRVHIDFFWLEFLFRDFHGLGFPGATVAAAVAVFMLSLVLQVGLYRLARSRPLRWPVLIGVQVLVLLAFGLGQVMHIVAYKRNDGRITALTPHYPLYMPFTSHRNAERYGSYLSMFDLGGAGARTGRGEAVRSLHYPKRPLAFDGASSANRPNILVILLESWRYDVVTPEISPRISQLADRSLVFENHLSSGNQTTCGLFGLLYGLQANYWTAVKANNAKIHNPVMIDRLEDLGYSFGVFADSNFERHKVKDTMFADIPVVEDFDGDSTEARDEDLARRLNEYIRVESAAGRPWFAFAFFKATHYSYYYPQEHRIFEPARDLRLGFTGGDTEPQKYWNDYCNSVHYDDELVGRIIDALEELGQLSNTVIVLTTDHGEEFNDNRANYWGHGSNFTRYQVQVPFILHLPGREPARIARKTGHIDLVPTLMKEVLGCTNDFADFTSGENLLTVDDPLRPFLVGSYFNHGFIIGDDVYDVGPTGAKEYDFSAIEQEAGAPDVKRIQAVMRQMNAFFGDGFEVARP